MSAEGSPARTGSPPADARLTHEIKTLLVEQLRLEDVTPESIADDESLVEGSLGLDSIDFLELTVAMEKKYGLKIIDGEDVEKIFRSVSTIAEHVARHRAGSTGS